MPPIARDEDCLTRLLNELISFLNQSRLEKSRINKMKEMNSFIILSFMFKISSFSYSKMNFRRKTNPVFMTLNASIPSRCAERVFMHCRSRSLAAHKEPSKRRSPIISKEFEIVILKVLWNFIIFN